MFARPVTWAAAALLIFAAYSGAMAQSPEVDTRPRAVLDADYRILKRVADFPPLLVDALAGRINATPLMADPWGRFNATDVVDTELPMRRLKFAGQSETGAFVYYEHGGFGFHYHLGVFEIRDGQVSLAFAGRFFVKARNLDRLRNLVAQGEIKDEKDVVEKHGYW